MTEITVYSTRFCPFCVQAKMLLKKLELDFTDIPVDNNPELRQEMMNLSGGYTVPQIFINQQAIGGCDELYALHRNGELESLLNK